MTEPEVKLVQDAKKGDRAAFEELVRRTSRLVYSRLYLETGDRHRTEDLLQETMLRAYRSLARLDNPARFRPWLLTIAVNVSSDAFRHDRRLKRGPATRTDSAALDGVPGTEARPEENAERKELRAQVLAVLRSMPDEYRLPLTLRYITGADYESICTQLGVSNGALRGLLHRGMSLFKARFQHAAVLSEA